MRVGHFPVLRPPFLRERQQRVRAWPATARPRLHLDLHEPIAIGRLVGFVLVLCAATGGAIGGVAWVVREAALHLLTRH
jgi:hypothetical protein